MGNLSALRQLVVAQETWIDQCGGTLEGYLDNYRATYRRNFGFVPADDDVEWRANIEAIFAADMWELAKRRAAVMRVRLQ